MVRLEDIEVGLKSKLSKQPISPRVLLDRLRMLDESSRKTSQYQDPNYLPFYYYLSKSIFPKSIFCFGLDLALPICCFLNGCETAKRILAFQKAGNSFYSPRVALSNIHDIRPSGISLEYYTGNILDSELESRMSERFDLAMITPKLTSDELNDVLEISWNNMNIDAFLVVDHILSDPKEGEIFKSFCKAKNCPYVIFDTRYGVAIAQK